MKKLFKKAMCLSLAATMALSVVGCGKGKDDSSGSAGQGPGKSSEAKKSNPDVVFAEDTDFAIDGIQGEATSFVVDGDDIYVLANEWDFGDASLGDAKLATLSDSEEYDMESQYTTRVYKASVDGGSPECIYEGEVDGEGYAGSLIKKNDGTLCFIKTVYGEDGNDYALFEYNGTEFEEKLDMAKVNDNSDAYLNSLLVNDQGQIFAMYDNEIKILDSDYKEINSINVEGYFDSSGMDKDGNVLITTSEYNEETEVSKTLLKKYDVEKNSFGDEYELDVSYLPTYDSIMPGTGEYDLFYRASTSIYGYKYADKQAVKIVDFSSSDVDEDYIGSISMLSEDEFICSYSDWTSDTYESKILKFKKVDPSQVDNRTVLTLASLWGNYQLKQAITDFNKSQDKYKIKMVDYSEESDPAAKLSADIASGDLPDMYDVSYGIGDMSIGQCIAKGLFEDLTPFLEKDPDISADDFIPAAYNAMLRDGKLYTVAQGFEIQTLCFKASEVGEEPGLTFQEMKDYVESKPEGTKIFYSNNKSDMLDGFMYYCGRKFVNWDKGECYFDSQDFKDMLEICNTGTNDEMDYEEEMPSTYDSIKSGELLCVDGYLTPDMIQMYSKMFDDDVSFKGYPDQNGEGLSFSYDGVVAMSSKCADKDAAWEFMKQFMSEEYQSKNYQDFYCVPIREDVYEAYIQSLSCTEQGKDKYGNDIYPREDQTYGMDGLEIKMEPITADDEKDFRALVDAATGYVEYDNSVNEIVEEEAEAYFKGDKSLDETCTIIQNRVTTYVNENK
ncbi:MAG: extracellular solute-binding protein [Eubacterium sp.]|nr:extracellular solute-binding protein [Eubacterium sp.]